MALTTVTITGRCPLPDDSVPANAQIVFTLSGYDTEGTDTALPVAREFALVGGALPAGVDLWANTEGLRGTYYTVAVHVRDPQTGLVRVYGLSNIQIDATPTTQTLVSLINNPVPAVPSWNVNLESGAYADLIADVAANKAKLAGIETGATADQTGAEIKAAYEAQANTNAFTDAQVTKLAGIETGATADQTGAEIKAAYEAEADTNAFTDAAAATVQAMGTIDRRSDPAFVYAIADEVGNVGIGIEQSGDVVIRRKGEVIYDTGSSPESFVWAIKDAADRVALGVRASGRVFAQLESGIVPASVLPLGAVRGMAGREVYSPRVYSSALRTFLSDAAGPLASFRQRADITSDTAILERDTLRVTLSYGQSLGVGGSDDPADPVYTSTPPSPHMALMLGTGLRGTGSTAEFDAAAATDFAPAVEAVVGTQSETPGSGYMTQRIAQDLAGGRPRQPYLFHAAGAGGQNIDALAVGTQPWLNLIGALDRIIQIAAIYDMAVEVDALVWTHGEANAATDPATYQTKLEAIITQFRAACVARGVAPAGGVPVLMDQVSSPSGNATGRTPNIAFASIAAADARAVISTAKYMLPTTDGVHLTPAGYRIFGEYIAKAAEDVTIWAPCRITGAALVADAITVTVHVPEGSLVRDTSQVPAVANDGFVYRDDSSSATITGVTIGATAAQTCEITLQLSATPSGANKRIEYAYSAAAPLAEPNFGAVGNIRDTSTIASAVPGADAGSGFLHNWLIVQPPLTVTE